VVRDGATGALAIAEDLPEGDPSVLVHDAHRDDPSYAFALSRLSGSDLRHTPMGVFRSVERPTYDRLLNEQVDRARSSGTPDLAGLIAGNDTWTVY
jgi:2-oxoglutarate ferredoxin oxidoreductase subunit beta